MIYDTFEQLIGYRGLNANLDRAIDYLLHAKLSELPVGRHEIDGERAFLLIQEPTLRAAEQAQFEVHRRYADIQLCIAGGEIIGYMPAAQVDAWGEFNVDKDIGFSCTAQKGVQLPLSEGQFMIFFPQDAHMPCIKADADFVRKAVVKVLVE